MKEPIFTGAAVAIITPMNEDGSFTIFIEERLSAEERKIEFLHAMRHIIGSDFSKEDVQKIENEAHAS